MFNWVLNTPVESSFRNSLWQVFFKTVLKGFANFTGKHLCWSLFSIKLQACRPATFEKRFQHRCFPVKFAKFSKTIFLQTTLRWLFCYFSKVLSWGFTKFSEPLCFTLELQVWKFLETFSSVFNAPSKISFQKQWAITWSCEVFISK